MAHIRIARSGHTPLHAVALLALCSCAAGLAGAAMARWLGPRVALPTALALSAGVALLVGLVGALPLLVSLAWLDHSLALLTQGDANLPSLGGWPLTPLLRRLEDIGELVAQVAERERQALTYRDELMRQVGEAAAREERNRLARELHDSIKQQLFSIGVSAAAARARAGESGAALSALDDIQRGAREAQVEMTALLQQLRPAPLENVGLVEALRDQCEALGYRTGAEVSVSIGELPAEDRLPPRAQEQLFRIAQEALANIARHARARHVWLQLERQGDAMILTIRDDGQGFDSGALHAGMGLSNLRERARALGAVAEIQSAPGQGAAIRVRTPLIEPLRVGPEEAERQAALAAVVRAGGRWMSWSMLGLQATCALIIFGGPFWSVALALVASASLYSQGRRAEQEVARLDGVGSEPELALRHLGYERQAWLLMLLALCVWYLPVSAPHGWLGGALLAIVIAASAALLAAGIVVWERWRRATGRYFQTLAPLPRGKAIRRRWDETVNVGVNVVIALILGALFGHWAPAIPPQTASQWSDSASIALIALLSVFTLVELWLSWRWRRTLTSRAIESEAIA